MNPMQFCEKNGLTQFGKDSGTVLISNRKWRARKSSLRMVTDLSNGKGTRTSMIALHITMKTLALAR